MFLWIEFSINICGVSQWMLPAASIWKSLWNHTSGRDTVSSTSAGSSQTTRAACDRRVGFIVTLGTVANETGLLRL